MNARMEAELRNRVVRARLGLLEEPSSPVTNVEPSPAGSVDGGGSSSGAERTGATSQAAMDAGESRAGLGQSAARPGSLSGPLTERDIGRGVQVTPGANPRHVRSDADGPNGGQSRSVSGDRSMREWALLYDKAETTAPSFKSRCAYCGGRCHGRVCANCRDLPQLEMEAHA